MATNASSPTREAVRQFTALSHDDLSFAGGKGANLGELTGAGFPVPPGLVIGAPAYAEFCASGLRERIAARLADLSVDDTAALEAAAADARQMILDEPIPEGLLAVLRKETRRADRRWPSTRSPCGPRRLPRTRRRRRSRG